MTITFGQLKQHAQLAIGGTPSIDEGQTVPGRFAEIVNQAGEHLFASDWNFRERTARNIALVADQAYVDLPEDVGELSAVYATDDGRLVEMTTPEQIEGLRVGDEGDGSSGIAYACFSRPQPNAGEALGTPRLELWPTPAAASSTGLTVRYQAGWRTIAEDAADSYVVPIPSYVEALLVQYVRAFALAYEDEGLGERIANIEAGPIWHVARSRDGRQQSDLGRLPAQSGTFPAAVSAFGPHSILSSPGQSLTIRWRGPFIEGDVYNVGDLVIHNRTTYIAALPPGLAVPAAPPWEVFCQGGNDGSPGPQGPPGIGFGLLSPSPAGTYDILSAQVDQYGRIIVATEAADVASQTTLNAVIVLLDEIDVKVDNILAGGFVGNAWSNP